jgi:hypothetical protein
MHVEHRRDRHVHVVGAQQAHAVDLPVIVATARVCSTSWRWVKYTPLGLPVVPVV